jgi:CelD/BcsL family acetyltransferase involved in cellulose biosynthesis
VRSEVHARTAPEEASLDPQSDEPGMRVRVVRDEAGLARLRADWRLLPTTPASDPDAYAVSLSGPRPPSRPHVLLVCRDDAPQALAAGREEEIALRSRVGYRVLAAPRLRALVFPAGSFVGTVDEPAAELLVDAIWSALRAGEAQVAVLHEIPIASPLFAAIRRAGWRACRDLAPDRNLRWSVAIPDGYDAYLRGRSARLRKTVRHAANRLHRELGSALEVRRFTDACDLERLFEDLETVAARTYQRRLGSGFHATPATRAEIAHAMGRGWFRAYVLYVGRIPCAFTYGIRHRGTYHSGATGFDPRLRLGTGDYLMNREIEDLCADPEIHRLDFGFGDADYKRRYADESHEEATIRLYAPTARAIVCNAGRAALAGLDRGLRAAARSLRLFDAVRRWERDRIRTAEAFEPTPR